MDARVLVLCDDDTLGGLYQSMVRFGLDEVPVVRDGRLIGRVDLEAAAFAAECAEHSSSCRDLKVITLLSSAPAVLPYARLEVVEASLASGSAVYVVEPDGTLVGRITAADLASSARAPRQAA